MNKKKKMMMQKDFIDYIQDMKGGDIIIINKRQGNKWVINTIAGDAYTINGFGASFEEAWGQEQEEGDY